LLIFLSSYLELGSVGERDKASFLWRPCDHNRVV